MNEQNERSMLYDQISDTMNKIEQGGISIHYLKHLQNFSYYKRLLYQSDHQEAILKKLDSNFTFEQKERFHIYWEKHWEFVNQLICNLATIPFYYHDYDLKNTAILSLLFQTIKELLKNEECKITLCWYYINNEFTPFEFIDHFSTLKQQEQKFVSKKLLLNLILEEYQNTKNHSQKVLTNDFSPTSFCDIKQ